MSNYRRLISYIYTYEGGIKGKNIGFAKLEARNGQCKIGVNVKKIYVGGSDMGVFLLSGDTEIKLGSIFIRNGVGEFRTNVSATDIENSGITLESCYGLSIHEVENAWRAYTTIWEDAVAHAAEIELADAVSENYEIQEEEREPVSVADEIAQEIEKQSEEPKPDEPKPDEPVPSGDWQEHGVYQYFPSPMPPVGDKTKLDELEQMDTAEEEHRNIWEFFKHQHGKIQAFDYQHGCEILTIKPQDIGLLPREIWVYGNNSFLLHGYYNYRYLILAKLENPQGRPRFLLGVPGHYYSNEKYMASMFGFPEFVLAKKQPSENGRFGYWYTDVAVND